MKSHSLRPALTCKPWRKGASSPKSDGPPLNRLEMSSTAYESLPMPMVPRFEESTCMPLPLGNAFG